MNAIRILHVDNEPDIRELVELSLSLNRDFQVRSSAISVGWIVRSGRAKSEINSWLN
jgi:hypothetical protein